MFQTDQHDSWPGATWAGPGPSPVAVTGGGGVVYIQYAAGGQYGQQHGIEMFDEKTLAYLGAFGTGGPNTNVGCPPCRVTYNRAGIAYYNGQVYASDPASDNIDVYDAQGNLKRSFPTMVGAPNGLGVAWGEVWVDLTTGNGGGSYDDTQNNNGGLPELGVYDAQTGALKAIVPIDAPCAAGDTEQLVENTDGCAPAGGNRGADGSPYNFWSPTFDFQDLAAAPELGGVFAQCHFVGRSAVLTQLSAVDEVDADHYGDCPTNGWLEGVQYVPGMSWLLASSGDPNVSYGMPGQYISEYSVGPGTAGTRLALRRRWQPMDAQANPGDNNNVMPAFRDAAYHYRGPQIDWSGNSTRPDWQHGNQCVRYIVSDADIFVAGWRGERWYDLARNFSSITFTLDGQTITTSTSPNGQVCFNEDSYSSGAHTLAASAVADGQTINISTSLHIDHTGPTGTINSQPQYVAHTITLSGNAVQPYSGLGTVTVQSSKDGTNWSTACSASVDHGDGNWTCQWDTTTVSDGAYQLRAAMSNNVQPAFGGATTGNSSTATTTIDNTPPVITNTAPDIYQAGYEMGGGDVTPVYLTALENLSGAASTTVFVNSATDGSSNGSWNSIGTVTGGGDQTIAWDSVSMPPGFYQLRAHSCNKAGACGDTYWQAEMASASCRPGQHKCPNQPCVSGAELGASGTFCYVAREAGNGDQWTSYGVSATITTPKNVPTQHNDAGGTFCDCAGDHTADYVNIGGGKYSNVWLQTGINTNCGIQSGSDDTWGDYAEYTSPQGMTYFQCFNPNGTGNPAGDGRTSPKGQVQSFKVVIGGGYHARADINGHPVMIQYEVPPTYGTCPDTDNDGDTQYDADNDGDSGTLSYCYVGRKFGKRAYLLEKQGLVNTDASGEINQVNGDNCRVLGGTFSNWQIAYRQGSFVSPSNPYTYSDTGYRWGSLTNTSWNVWGPDNC
jgi:hypothetical protein